MSSVCMWVNVIAVPVEHAFNSATFISTLEGLFV